MGNSDTWYDFSVIHIDLVFIVYGAILQSYYGAIGYSTVEQSTKRHKNSQRVIPAIPMGRNSCIDISQDANIQYYTQNISE